MSDGPDKATALRTELEDAGYSTPFLLTVADRLQQGIEILNETADAESAAAALAEILSEPDLRVRLVKAAARFAHDDTSTARKILKEIAESGQITDEEARAKLLSGEASPPPVSPSPFRQGDLKQLIDDVAAAKNMAVQIDERARRFFEAARSLGFTPSETEQVRCATAYFRYLQLEETLTEFLNAISDEYGEDKGGPPVSQNFIDRPFEQFAKTLADLWVEKEHDFRRKGMQDFEKVLSNLIEELAGQEMPVNRWKDLKRELKQAHNPS